MCTSRPLPPALGRNRAKSTAAQSHWPSWAARTPTRSPAWPPRTATRSWATRTARCLWSASEARRVMTELAIPLPIVVGIDGSKAAIRTALWAVDEAVSRDAPLRLVCAVEQGDTGTAEIALHHARNAIEAVGKAVKIETEVAHGPAIGSLIGTSASAAMVCVGAVGLRHF